MRDYHSWLTTNYYQLQTVAAACGYDLTRHHNALVDTEVCAAIAQRLLLLFIRLLLMLLEMALRYLTNNFFYYMDDMGL